MSSLALNLACQYTYLIEPRGTELEVTKVQQTRFGMQPVLESIKSFVTTNSDPNGSTGRITKAGFFVYGRPTHDSQCGFIVPACQDSNLQREALARSERKPKRLCGHIGDSNSSARTANWNGKLALYDNLNNWHRMAG